MSDKAETIRELLSALLLVDEDKLKALMIDPYGTLRDAWNQLGSEQKHWLKVNRSPGLVDWLTTEGESDAE